MNSHVPLEARLEPSVLVEALQLQKVLLRVHQEDHKKSQPAKEKRFSLVLTLGLQEVELLPLVDKSVYNYEQRNCETY